MATTVQFDERVSALAGGAEDLPVSAPTVREALFQVAKAYPALRLFNCDGDLRSIMQVRQNDEPAELSAPVQDGDTLRLCVG